MTSNISSETASNVTESASSSAAILIQMTTHIEQLEEHRWQQNLKIDKSDQFDETKEKLRQWLMQMNVHMSTQFYQLETEKDKIMLTISYLIRKIADWVQSYINRKFHSENDNKEDKMFSNYQKFVNKITTAFESVNLKREIKHKLEHLRQKKSVSNYVTDFRQIVSVLDWNEKAYVSLFY